MASLLLKLTEVGGAGGGGLLITGATNILVGVTAIICPHLRGLEYQRIHKHAYTYKHTYTAMHTLAQVASDRGPPYLHMRTTDIHGQNAFLADLIYSDMTLLSGIICCLGTPI